MDQQNNLPPLPRRNESSNRWFGRLWIWLTEPHPAIQERDQRRLARLLSTFILGFFVLAVVLETITVALIPREQEYTGYRQTIVVVFFLVLVYGLSRTRYYRVAATLTLIITSAGIFYAALAQPSGILGGLLDYLIIPVWLGSIFFYRRHLIYLLLLNLIGLLLIPLFVPTVSYKLILIGPVGFLIVVAVPLFLMIHSRDLLEQDRQADLIVSENRFRREAARAQALLSVAHRLNANLDQDMLLVAICEETAKALEVPVVFIDLYDKKTDTLYPTAGIGLSDHDFPLVPPLARSVLEQGIQEFGETFAIQEWRDFSALPKIKIFETLNLRSLALGSIFYEGELIGCIVALTVGMNQVFAEDQQLLLKGLCDQAALAIVNTRLYKDARRRLEHLQALRAIDIAITTNHDLQQTLDVLLAQITQRLGVDAAVILLLDTENQYLYYAASQGLRSMALRHARLRMGEGAAGIAAERRLIYRIADLQEKPHSFVHSVLFKQEKMITYFAAPLIAKDQIKGVLEIFHRSFFEPDEEWLAFLEALAGQTAIAIDNSTLFDDLQQTNHELSQAYDSTIEGWSRALDLRDKETVGHTLRVTEMTLHLARIMNLDKKELTHIRRGALLHDIGKMGIPDNILLKPGPLTEEEWEIMRRHPVYAYEMLQPVEYLRLALDIPYYHHEKWDGTGYPEGLKGEAIPLSARIFAVVDVWDALSSDRPYRKGWSPDRVVEHIRSQSGIHFDPEIVEVFLKLLGEI
jgi:putative nucleotidyltransferase with HDIG domain